MWGNIVDIAGRYVLTANTKPVLDHTDIEGHANTISENSHQIHFFWLAFCSRGNWNYI